MPGERGELLCSRRASACQAARRHAHGPLEPRDFVGEGVSAGGGDPEPLLTRAVVASISRRAVERTDQPLFVELVEGAVERDGPELELTIRKFENVAHDRRAMAIAVSEREKDVEPVTAHAGSEAVGALYWTV